MSQPKIERLLRLMVMMTGNTHSTINEFADTLNTTQRSIYRYICTIRSSGFAVEKIKSNVYRLGKMPKSKIDFSKLIYFSEEEGHIIYSLIHSLDNTNRLKLNLQKKLAAIYTTIAKAEIISDNTVTNIINSLGEAIENKKKVRLNDYESANSGIISNKFIEPFAFSTNYIDIMGYDIEKKENRIYKISRIGSVSTLDEDWTYEDHHEIIQSDCFRMNGKKNIPIKLELSLKAKNLLIEEYPLAETDIIYDDNKFYLVTNVCNLAGVGRFVIGLADEIRIIESPELKIYIEEFVNNHLMKTESETCKAPL